MGDSVASGRSALADVSGFEAFAAAPPRLIPTDPTSGIITSVADMWELLRLRLRSELHRKPAATHGCAAIDEDAFKVLASALDDVWSDMKDPSAAPFLDARQTRTLVRALPWLAIERAATSYMGYVDEVARLDTRGVFSSSANRIRCISKLGPMAEESLDLASIRKQAIQVLIEDGDPTSELAPRYDQLRKRARTPEPVPRPPSPPKMSRNVVARCGPLLEAQLFGPRPPEPSPGAAAVERSGLCSPSEGTRGGAMSPRSLSAPQRKAATQQLEDLGIDTTPMDNAMNAVGTLLKRTATPTYEVATERLLRAADGKPQRPITVNVGRDLVTPHSKRRTSSTGTMVESPHSAGLIRVQPHSPPPPPPPPPPPLPPAWAADAAAEKNGKNQTPPVPKVLTSHDQLGEDVLKYLRTNNLPPESGLEYVSQRLLSRMGTAAAAERARGLGIDDGADMAISPLLMATLDAGRRGRPEPSPPRESIGHGPREGPTSPRARYLPPRAAASSATRVDVNKLLQRAEAYAAQVTADRRQESWSGVGTSQVFVKGLGVHLKMPGPRPSDRIAAPKLLLEDCGVLYHEFDTQLDSDVLREIDANLYTVAGIQSALTQIVDAVDVSLGAWRSAELKQPDFVAPSRGRKWPAAITVPERTVGAAAGGPPVLNESLGRMQADLPGQGMTATRSYSARPKKVVAAPGAGKEENRKAREYAAWKKWWNSTLTATDYLEWMKEQQTDLLGVACGLFDDEIAHNAAADEEEDGGKVAADALTADELAAAARMQATMQRRGQRTAGTWNTDTVRLGGLGWDGTETEPAPSQAAAGATEFFGRLEQAWRTLELPTSTRIKLGVKYAGMNGVPDGGTAGQPGTVEDIALDMRKAKARCADAVTLWEQAAVGVVTRERLLRDLHSFERTASNPLRFFSAGHNTAGDRLSEERRRRRLDSKLTKVSADLKSSLDALSVRFGDIVPHGDATDYRSKMRSDRRAVLLQLEHERRRGGSAPSIATIGAKFPVLPPVASASGGSATVSTQQWKQ